MQNVSFEKEACSLRLVFVLVYTQMVQLTAELERSTDKRLKLERELVQTKHNLEIVSEQKSALVKTTEKYQADKRELEEEVGRV